MRPLVVLLGIAGLACAGVPSEPAGVTAPQTPVTPSEGWHSADSYEVRVHAAKQEQVARSSGVSENIVYLDVECRNVGAANDSCRAGQWQVFDAAGHVYESEYLPAELYGDRGRQPLRETMLLPGSNVRGWLAFKLPAGEIPSRYQFFTGYLSADIVDFPWAEFG